MADERRSIFENSTFMDVMPFITALASGFLPKGAQAVNTGLDTFQTLANFGSNMERRRQVRDDRGRLDDQRNAVQEYLDIQSARKANDTADLANATAHEAQTGIPAEHNTYEAQRGGELSGTAELPDGSVVEQTPGSAGQVSSQGSLPSAIPEGFMDFHHRAAMLQNMTDPSAAMDTVIRAGRMRDQGNINQNLQDRSHGIDTDLIGRRRDAQIDQTEARTAGQIDVAERAAELRNERLGPAEQLVSSTGELLAENPNARFQPTRTGSESISPATASTQLRILLSQEAEGIPLSPDQMRLKALYEQILAMSPDQGSDTPDGPPPSGTPLGSNHQQNFERKLYGGS